LAGPVRIEVEPVAVPKVSGIGTRIELHTLRLAITDKNKHVESHFLGLQAGKCVDVLLEAG
jgi:hypothetical protein